jgi:protein TonB
MAGFLSMNKPQACPPVLPRVILTASLGPAGCGSGQAGPAPAAPSANAEATPEPPAVDEQQRPYEEALAAPEHAPAPLHVPAEKPVSTKPKRRVSPKSPEKTKPQQAAQEPRQAAAPAPEQTGAASAPQGGGSGASAGPPLPSGGAPGQGTLGAPLAASDLDSQPALLFAPKPDYPFQAKRQGLRGKLRVRLLVGMAGHVERVDILGGENVEAFAESVRTTLGRWRFKPGTKQGTPVHWVAILPIAFEQE